MAELKNIEVRGAREHNLKGVDIDLPRDKMVVFTGLSGSGKSSLAFDTLYAEGQRRYVESLSTYARQFLQLMDKPDVDLIEGLSPAIAIQQKAASHNPRSTVGTVTEIHDYMRLLWARVGVPYSPATGLPIEALQQGAVQIGVPSTMLSGSAEHYALEVKGDSMIEAGIGRPASSSTTERTPSIPRSRSSRCCHLCKNLQ